MKYVFFLAILFLLSCQSQPVVYQTSPQPVVVVTPPPVQNYNPQYQVMENNGQQVVYVHDGATSFFMDYLIFNSLFNSGGWGSVYGRYHSNPNIYYNPGLVSRYHSYHVNTYRTNYLRTNVNTYVTTHKTIVVNKTTVVNKTNVTNVSNRTSISTPTVSQRSFTPTVRTTPVSSSGFGSRSSSSSFSSSRSFGSSSSSGFGKRR